MATRTASRADGWRAESEPRELTPEETAARDQLQAELDGANETLSRLTRQAREAQTRKTGLEEQLKAAEAEEQTHLLSGDVDALGRTRQQLAGLRSDLETVKHELEALGTDNGRPDVPHFGHGAINTASARAHVLRHKLMPFKWVELIHEHPKQRDRVEGLITELIAAYHEEGRIAGEMLAIRRAGQAPESGSPRYYDIGKLGLHTNVLGFRLGEELAALPNVLTKMRQNEAIAEGKRIGPGA